MKKDRPVLSVYAVLFIGSESFYLAYAYGVLKGNTDSSAAALCVCFGTN